MSNNKANKDLSNVTYPAISAGSTTTGAGDRVIETYIRANDSTGNRSWYRKWASGWKECAIKTHNTNIPSNGSAEAILPIKFTDASTVICIATPMEWLNAQLYTYVYKTGDSTNHSGTVTQSMEGQYIKISVSAAAGQSCSKWQLYCWGD